MNKLFKTFRKHFGKSDAQSIINSLNVINYKEGGQTDDVKVEWCNVSVTSASSLQVIISYYDNKYPIGILKVQVSNSAYYFHTTFIASNTSGKITYQADITDSTFRTIYENNKNLQALCIIYN